MNDQRTHRTVRVENIKAADGMENVHAGEKENVNKLYKKYVEWHRRTHPGQIEMSFKQWLKWWQSKHHHGHHFSSDAGEIQPPIYRAEGDEQKTTTAEDKVVTDPQTKTKTDATKKKSDVLGKAKKIIPALLIVGLAAVLVYAIANASEKSHAA